MRTLGDIPGRYARLSPAREALVFEDRRISWSTFNDRINRLANWLLHRGFKAGDTISALAQNCNQYYELYYASFKIGTIMAPVNYRLGPTEMLYLLDLSQSRILFVGAEYHDFVQENLERMENVEVLVSFDGAVAGMLDYEDILASSSPSEPGSEVGEDEVALISFTGGTTGLPKGAMLTHRNFFTVMRTILIYGDLTADDITLQVLPPFHLTIWQTLIAHYIGAKSVLNKKLDLHHVMGLFAQEGITHINLVPVLLNWIVNDPQFAEYDFSSLRNVTYGGSPIPMAVLEKCLAAMQPRFSQGYGLTECTLLATVLGAEDHLLSSDPAARKHLQSAGREALHNEVRVVDGEGNGLPSGEVGEIIIKGPNVMKGYWRDAEQTADRIKEGWLYSNDMGYFDEDGYLYIVDRKQFMIITGGENVYPKEVEDILYQHPAVSEAAVVSAPDERWGETVAAAIVTKEGVPLTADEITSFCRERLAGYKCPRIVRFVDTLPKTPIMKIDAMKVREDFWKGHERKVT
ncbi:MAG: long-chain-fatty-acid--CoA ligase [Actinobacteria bacterium]|jgi:acyl-CoA synthetase (AMP-forming)/AMP-acid ligase II|nr:MAG: long-chain-fatty-acid--CoA ligase [Actinomycetota bacterium]